ncbi:hypothetical protein KCP70_17630 [Salmonella enterica subsp. enterica]|nr:hypothetical protein KCP70_17630 [Salmonella enterica subsp. enterica]
MVRWLLVSYCRRILVPPNLRTTDAKINDFRTGVPPSTFAGSRRCRAH